MENVLAVIVLITLLIIGYQILIQPKIELHTYKKLKSYSETLLADLPQWDVLIRYSDIYFEEIRSRDYSQFDFSVYDYELHIFKSLFSDAYILRDVSYIQHKAEEELILMQKLLSEYKECSGNDSTYKVAIWNDLINSKRNLKRILDGGMRNYL